MPKSIGELLLGAGVTKTASERGGSNGDLQAAAAAAQAGTQIEALTKEAEEELGGQMAYLGYCFGWGLNKAAMEFQKQAEGGLGNLHAPETGAAAGAGGVGDSSEKHINDAGPSGAMQTNTTIPGKGFGHGVAQMLQNLIQKKVNTGATASGPNSMNAGEQKQSSDRGASGSRFRSLLLQKLSEG